METHTGIGYSQNPDVEEAAREAAEQARQNLNQSRIDLAVVFNTIHYPAHKIIPKIHSLLDQTRLIGASTAGLILPGKIETKGITVLAVTSEDMRFENGHVARLDLQRDMRAAGSKLIQACMTTYGVQDRKCMLFFIDGLLDNSAELIDGIHEKTGASFPVIGLRSSDNFNFQQTFQYHNNTILTNSVTAVLLGGKAAVSTSCQHGWKPLGKPRLANRVENNVIRSLDGKTPSKLFEEYFGGEAASLKKGRLGDLNIRYPLGFKIQGKKEYCLRNVVSVLDDGSIVCQDKIPEGAGVHLMINTKDGCIKAGQNAVTEIKTKLRGAKPKILFVFESLARHRLLGRLADKEIWMIQNAFPKDTTVIGMYTYGEISPNDWMADRATPNFFQNNSIILMALA